MLRCIHKHRMLNLLKRQMLTAKAKCTNTKSLTAQMANAQLLKRQTLKCTNELEHEPVELASMCKQYAQNRHEQAVQVSAKQAFSCKDHLLNGREQLGHL